jgi:hypothetical protein
MANPDPPNKYENGNRAAESHGTFTYLSSTRHYLAARDPGPVPAEFREAEAAVLEFVAEHGPQAVIALIATRATLASELMWSAMMTSPTQFRKYADQWRQLSGAAIRAWRELKMPEGSDDLAEARREALEALENQS